MGFKYCKSLVISILSLFIFNGLVVSADSAWDSVPEERKEFAKEFYLSLREEGVPVVTASAMTARGGSESGFHPYKLEGEYATHNWANRLRAPLSDDPPAYGFLQMQSRAPSGRLGKMIAKVESYMGGAGTSDPKIASRAQAKFAVEEFNSSDIFKTFGAEKRRMVFTTDMITKSYTLYLNHEGVRKILSLVGKEVEGLYVPLTGIFYPFEFDKHNLNIENGKIDSFEKFKEIKDPRVAVLYWTVSVVRPANWAVFGTYERDMENATSIAEEFGGLSANYDINTNFEDKSILQELITPSLIMSRNNGFFFDPLGENDNRSKDIAKELQTSTIEKTKTEKKYSLYERFGSDIHFYRYMGEATQPIQLFDHIYSAVDQDVIGQLNIGTLFYESSRYLSNQVYQGRPKVLTRDEIKDGMVDPRVRTLDVSIFNGYSFNASEFNLGVSKFVVGIVTTFLSNEPLKAIKGIVDNFLGLEIWNKTFKPLVMYFSYLGVIFFIISIGFGAFRALKGNDSFNRITKRVIAGLIGIALIFGLSNNPIALNELVYKSATTVDGAFNQLINIRSQGDEVVSSTDGEKATEALLWKTAIFNNWIKGIFRTDYENLYTHFSDKPIENRMVQSTTSSDVVSNLKTGEFVYDSVNTVGDVSVPIGQGEYIKNWGAYLYSTQSKYHIDQQVIDGKNTAPSSSFPNALTTARNSTINADVFRVIDAQMNISPQIYKDNLKVANYTGSNLLSDDNLVQSYAMLLNSVILFVSFMPMIVKKLMNLLMVFLSIVQMIYFSIVELFKEGEGFDTAFDSLSGFVLNFILSVFNLFVLTLLYSSLIGKGILPMILYGFIVYNIYNLSISRIRNMGRDVKDRVKYYKNMVVRKF